MAVIELAPQFDTVAKTPFKATVLLPCVEPKFRPPIVTDVPAGPKPGDTVDMLGHTVKATPLLFTPLTLTTTFPLVAPLGTRATIELPVQLLMLAGVPLKVTEPCDAPKLLPLIVMDAPTAPDGDERLVILGGGTTVNSTPLLDLPLTVTTTLPVAALLGTTAVIEPELQFEIWVTLVPPNVTVLVPWLEPNPLPAMITDAPFGPEFGVRLVIEGLAA